MPSCAQPVELLDIYPTLADLCDLPLPEFLEGHSLTPQLADAAATRAWPAITTHNHDNHGVRSLDWRYIRYADGSEELYNKAMIRMNGQMWLGDACVDFNDTVTSGMATCTNRKPVPGSKDRILLYDAAAGPRQLGG